jgi:3-oxoacyl-[acyl-carrier-protein] synthase II
MGAAGALELSGNLLSFVDGKVHGSKNLKDPDELTGGLNLLKDGEVKNNKDINTILNISFGMLGINSCVIVKKYKE